MTVDRRRNSLSLLTGARSDDDLGVVGEADGFITCRLGRVCAGGSARAVSRFTRLRAYREADEGPALADPDADGLAGCDGSDLGEQVGLYVFGMHLL
jgi:hypothetical protein